MTTAAPSIHITRESLRDGSLLAMARARIPAHIPVRTDEDIAALLDSMLTGHPPHHDVWLFGYGSLMWNPAMRYAEHIGGRVLGWHRRYCSWITMGRGTPENPGLMLALDRGGSSAGALFRVPADEARAELLLPFRRELFTHAYEPRWVRVQTGRGPVRALTFVANRAGSRYAGPLDEPTIARHLASAGGQLGTCTEYLTQTLAALDALGLSDRRLTRLARLAGCA